MLVDGPITWAMLKRGLPDTSAPIKSPEQSGFFVFAMIGTAVELVRPTLKGLYALTATTSALSITVSMLFTRRAWPLSVVLGFLALCWTGYSFVKFGRRAWVVLVAALPSLWPFMLACMLAWALYTRSL